MPTSAGLGDRHAGHWRRNPALVPGPLRYPLASAIPALGLSVALRWTPEWSTGLGVFLGVLGYTAFRYRFAVRHPIPAGHLVRQRQRLTSRGWIEVEHAWVPVYWDQHARVAYPSGRTHEKPPPGRLIDVASGLTTNRKLWHRVVLDLQPAIAAPIAGGLWVMVSGGGLTSWAYATTLVAALAFWWTAVNGSDPT